MLPAQHYHPLPDWNGQHTQRSTSVWAAVSTAASAQPSQASYMPQGITGNTQSNKSNGISIQYFWLSFFLLLSFFHISLYNFDKNSPAYEPNTLRLSSKNTKNIEIPQTAP